MDKQLKQFTKSNDKWLKQLDKNEYMVELQLNAIGHGIMVEIVR